MRPRNGDIGLRIPRHLDTQPTIIWTLVPRSPGHLIRIHLDRQSSRSDAGLHNQSEVPVAVTPADGCAQVFPFQATVGGGLMLDTGDGVGGEWQVLAQLAGFAPVFAPPARGRGKHLSTGEAVKIKGACE